MVGGMACCWHLKIWKISRGVGEVLREAGRVFEEQESVHWDKCILILIEEMQTSF